MKYALWLMSITTVESDMEIKSANKVNSEAALRDILFCDQPFYCGFNMYV